jgi:hypothetical protein
MSSLPRRALAVLAFLGVTLALAREARADDLAVDLYTIGPGNYLYARYGHSLLCSRPATVSASVEKGRCFDYGVADREDAFHVFWSAVRNQPSFVPIVVDEAVVLKFFRDQGRTIERQRLPLSPTDAARLVARMDDDVREKRAYAYHAYRANCSTQIRDRIDDASGEKLRPGPSKLPKLRCRSCDSASTWRMA